MDYCTLFPEGWWSTCCQIHDTEYAMQIGQALADANLLKCVINSGGDPITIGLSVIIGVTMWIGVRIFGSKFYRGAK